MTLLNIKILRNCMASVLVGFSGFTLGQDVVVEEFTPGVVVSSASVNSNFGKLADKTNDNGTRLSTVEGNVSSISSAMTARRLRWMGYTTQPFDADTNYLATLNGYTLSAHCKTEFGSAAFVASDLDLEEIIRTDDFVLPSDGAYILFFGDGRQDGSPRSAFFDVSKSSGPETMLQSNGRISSASRANMLPAACVAYD